MNAMDPMLEVYIYENSQLLEKLEEMLLDGERNASLSIDQINEIFRVMHTIKGSSAMMNFDNVAKISHAVEDLFAHIRERYPRQTDWLKICGIVLSSVDFIKLEIAKMQEGKDPDGDCADLVDEIEGYLEQLMKRKIPEVEAPKEEAEDEEALDFDMPGKYYSAFIRFEPDSKMENIRAFGILNELTPYVIKVAHVPEDIFANNADEIIATNGFYLYIKTNEDPEKIRKVIGDTLFVRMFEFHEVDEKSPDLPESIKPQKPDKAAAAKPVAAGPAPTGAADSFLKQNFISVNINKLDKLINLVGEIVITESMVTKSPDLKTLVLDNFEKSARQLRKLTDELQDVVMSIRMVPVSTTFHKMHRLVRDMSKKVRKDAELIIIGEETEVDKNIIDSLGDPLMHIIRNAMDHGLETADERAATDKPPVGKITLEARNQDGDVLIIVSDDGKGLNRSAIIKNAIERGITTKSESEITDKEAFSFVLLPGFSTKEQVTEFSGRGVGMDVVRKNIEKVGGTVSLESAPGKGTSIYIRIPLTLAIVDGMQILVGDSMYIIPILSIRESFKPQQKDIIIDPDGNEMIMIRGECYPVLRLYKEFDIPTQITDLQDGIMIVVESDHQTYCLFADAIIGEQQAVVKPIPQYILRSVGRIRGMGGCTILGDGSISLILDINSLVS